MYLTDFHTHSILSFDGQAPLSQMAAAARAAGVRELCVTDHCDFLDEGGAPVRTYDWDRAVEQFEQTAAALAGGELTLRLGLELGMPHLDPAAAQAICSRDGVDFILGSVHNLSPERGGGDFYYEDLTDPAACYGVLDDYFASLLALARTDYYDVLAHIIYPLRYMNPAVTLERYTDVIRAILRAAVERGRGIELNTCRGQTLEPWRPILALYRACGGEIVTLGSDAHTPGDVGRGIPEALALLEQCSFRRFAVYRRHQPIFHTL